MPKRRIFACLLALFAVSAIATAEAIKLEKGDHICLIGNELGERLQHHNYWETLLHQRFADQNLTVRNLCLPGDEVDLRIRVKNFGSPHKHLTHSKANVVLYFFGFNESFDGMEGLDEFKSALDEMLKEAKDQDYSGSGAPRIALVSPIAFENTGDRNLPDGNEHNMRLAAYSKAIGEVAKAHDVHFVDLFTPTKALFEQSNDRMTLNGSHLNEKGYAALAPVLLTGLVGVGGDAPTFDEKVHAEIEDKNFHWWHRYRAVNGFSIYGDRGKAGEDGSRKFNNEDVMERERTILDQMTAIRGRADMEACQWRFGCGKTGRQQYTSFPRADNERRC